MATSPGTASDLDPRPSDSSTPRSLFALCSRPVDLAGHQRRSVEELRENPLTTQYTFESLSEENNVRLREVSLVKGRSWKDLALAWLPEIRKDLRDGLEHWTDIAALGPAGGSAATPLRALDTVAWRLVEEKDPRPRKRQSARAVLA